MKIPRLKWGILVQFQIPMNHDSEQTWQSNIVVLNLWISNIIYTAGLTGGLNDSISCSKRAPQTPQTITCYLLFPWSPIPRHVFLMKQNRKNRWSNNRQRATRKAFLLQRATLEPEPLLGFPPTMGVWIPRRFPSTAWLMKVGKCFPNKYWKHIET